MVFLLENTSTLFCSSGKFFAVFYCGLQILTFFKNNTEQAVICSFKVNLIDISEKTACFLILPNLIFLWAGYQFCVTSRTPTSCWILAQILAPAFDGSESVVSQLEEF